MVSQNIEELVQKMVQGDKASLAHLISLIERESPDVPHIMELVSPFLHNTYRIGITGLAGAGKSTTIDKLVTKFRERGLTVSVIAVDPSSLLTGGAVLGDRIRMQDHYLDEGVFIRSMGTRGCYGGLCKSVENAARLMDASGKDVIIIETTGVGQTETDIIHVADVTVMLLIPGYGDSIQLMKAGLVEVADIIVINKSDLEGADILESQVRDELMFSPKKDEQTVLLTQASNNIGIEELYEEIDKRRKAHKSSRVPVQPGM
jgi:LAO/AO transport system kinase